MHVARTFVAATAAALLVACGNDDSKTPVFRGIAYVRDFASGPSEVWLVPDDGSTRRRIARGAIVQTLLSPDGRWVALVDERYDLLVVPTSGGKPRRLARSVWPSEWSPDSSFVLARTVEESSAPTLVTVDLDGHVSEVRRGYIGGYSLSPDGKEVCFDVATARGEFGDLGDLYVVGTDGRNVRRLTRDGASAEPLWTEHGIAFAHLVRATDNRRLPNNAWGADEIWRIDPDGRHARRIAKPPRKLLGSGIVGFSPEAWSRDGRRIVASLANEFGGPPFTIDLATGKVRRLGPYSYHATTVGLSRDGRDVLVEESSVELNRWWAVHVVPYEGGRPRLIARYALGASWNR